ncbi:MAG: DNA repair protein RadC [Deltaproteobacteria bacterium]|nr:DNA repair protein RadC [Deltaproteobacteria bacterium]
MSAPTDDQQLRLLFARAEPKPASRITPLRVRVELVRDAPATTESIVFTGAASIYAFLREDVAAWDRERFLTVILDNKHRLIGIEEVSVGTLSSALVHPREVFKAIILANAAAFAVAHNHPSGDPTPSREDIEITRRLREVADLFGIRFLDHIIIGRGRYVSFVDDGYW